MAQSPTPGQINAYNGAQGTGTGVIFDALGNPKIVGANMPVGASAGYLVQSDGSGNLSLGALQPSATPTWTPADQGFIAWNYDGPASLNGGNVALATGGTLYVQAVKLPAAALVTNIVTAITANGNTLTSGQCFAALYQGAGGALLGVTADQASNWAAGSTTRVATMAIAGGPVLAHPGVLYVAFWFNGTTGPSFFRTEQTPFANAGLAATASRWGTADTSITTTAPATLGTIAAPATPTAYWAGLS